MQLFKYFQKGISKNGKHKSASRCIARQWPGWSQHSFSWACWSNRQRREQPRRFSKCTREDWCKKRHGECRWCPLRVTVVKNCNNNCFTPRSLCRGFLISRRCMPSIDLTGHRFGKLTVLQKMGSQNRKTVSKRRGRPHPNLLFAYDSSCAEGVLQLIPLAAPAPPAPSQPPTPVPTAPTRQEPTIWRNGKKIQFREAIRL